MPKSSTLKTAAQPSPYDNATQAQTRRGRKKGAEPLKASTVEELREISAASRKEFGKSKTTRQQYERYIESGKQFLADCVEKRRKETKGETDSVDNDLLARAFEGPPNKASVDALEFYLVQKCLQGEQKCTHSTAACIVAAFASYRGLFSFRSAGMAGCTVESTGMTKIAMC